MKFFTKQCCEDLLKFTSQNELRANYFKDAFDPSYFRYLTASTNYDIPRDLQLNESPGSDLENSIKIFEALKYLDRVQANDKRLWVTLTHVTFFEYTKKRWAINENDSDEKILRRFHFEGSSLAARMRNSISRLWWSAKLTYDEERKDKYELTKLLWSKQDIYQNIVERSYGTYDPVVKGFLEFYSDRTDLKEDQLRQLFTALNSVGGVKVLSMHSKSEIKDTLVQLSDYYKFSTAS